MSDNLTHFKTGAIRDQQDGKEDYVETIPWIAMRALAIYLTEKQSRYGRGNYKKGFDPESFETSGMRHLQKYFAIKEYRNRSLTPPPETEPDQDHLCAAIWNFLGLVYEREIAKHSTPTEPLCKK